MSQLLIFLLAVALCSSPVSGRFRAERKSQETIESTMIEPAQSPSPQGKSKGKGNNGSNCVQCCASDDDPEEPPPDVGPTPVPSPTTEPQENPLDPNRFLLCRQIPEREGFGFDEAALDYQTGEPLYSELTETEANTRVTDILTTVGAIVAGGAALAGPAYKNAAAALTFGAGVLGVATHFAGKSETSLLGASIQNQFRETNRQIDELTDIVKAGFDNVRQDFTDNSLDEIMAPLQAIEFAFREMVQSYNESSPTLKHLYTEKYRAVCNTAQNKPADIFRELYGFACGDAGANRDCAASDGVATGKCQFGFKKRAYVLDTYNDLASGDVERFKTFSLFLPQAMLLAQFHTAACPVAEAASCADAFTDQVRLQIASDQEAAYKEVLANLQRKEECFQEEFRANINADRILSILGNEECLAQEGELDQDKNGCLANLALSYLTKRFPAWDFLIVTYNFGDDANDDDRELVDWDGETNDLYGFFHFPDIAGVGSRHYHIMYRAKQGTAVKKENWDADDGRNALDWVLDPFNRIAKSDFPSGCPFRCNCARANKFWSDTAGNVCGGCDADPGFRPVAAREHGFIVFRTNNGIPRNAASSDFGRFDIFWAPQLEERSIDIVPFCDDKVEFIA